MTDRLAQRDQPEQVVQREAPVLQAPPVEPDLRVQQRGSEHQQQAQGLLVLLQVDPIRLKYLLSQYRQGRQDQQVQQVRRDLRARLAQPAIQGLQDQMDLQAPQVQQGLRARLPDSEHRRQQQDQ